MFDTVPHSSAILLLAFAATFVGGVIRGFTGFGMALAVVPTVGLAVDPAVVVPAVLLMAFFAGLPQTVANRAAVHWPSVSWLCLGSVPATPVGIALLTVLPADWMRAFVAVAVIVAVALLAWGRRRQSNPGRAETALTGVASGLLNGAIATPGPPVIAFYLSSPAGARIGRASLMAFFSLTGIAGVVAVIAQGLTGAAELWLAATMAPAYVLGSIVGGRRFRQADEVSYRRYGLIVLGLIGLVGLADATRRLILG